jgi:hypothetical protein
LLRLYTVSEEWGNDTNRGKLKSMEKLLPWCATLSTLNPTWNALGLNLGLCGVKTATNRLSHGIALPLLNMDYE